MPVSEGIGACCALRSGRGCTGRGCGTEGQRWLGGSCPTSRLAYPNASKDAFGADTAGPYGTLCRARGVCADMLETTLMLGTERRRGAPRSVGVLRSSGGLDGPGAKQERGLRNAPRVFLSSITVLEGSPVFGYNENTLPRQESPCSGQPTA